MWLTLIVFLPLLTALALILIPRQEKGAIRILSLLGSLVTFLIISAVVINYQNHSEPNLHTLYTSQLKSEINQLVADPTERELLFQAVLQAEWWRGEQPFLARTAEQQDLAAQIEARNLQDVWPTKITREMREKALALQVPSSKHLRYVEYRSWVSTFGIHYFLAVDGLSLPFLWLTGFVFVIVIVYSWKKAKELKAYFALLLVLETGLLGTLVAMDFFLFFAFWELVLLPIYFLVGIWGGTRRIYGALKFFLFTLFSSLLLLLGMLIIYFQARPHSFNLVALMAMDSLKDFYFQRWIFPAIFLALAIRLPLFPFHAWLADLQSQAPSGTAAIVVAAFLPTGIYGMLRILFPLCPLAASSQLFVVLVGGLALINILYGALVALAQRDFKDLLSYSLFSLSGFSLLGLVSFSTLGSTGALFHQFNLGLIFALLFLAAGVLQSRASHRDIGEFGGLATYMPWFSLLTLAGLLALIGLPGLNGFVSEMLVLMASLQSESSLARHGAWIPYVSLLGLIITAGYVLWTIQRIFLGKIKASHRGFQDLQLHELMALVPLAFACLALGLYPSLLIDLASPTLETLFETLNQLVSP